MVNICTDFNLSNKNLPQTLTSCYPSFISHHLHAPPASSDISQCNSHVSYCCLFNVRKIINNKKIGMQPPNLQDTVQIPKHFYRRFKQGLAKICGKLSACAPFRLDTTPSLRLVGDFLAIFPSPELFPARESLISDIPAGYGKISNLFLQSTTRKYQTKVGQPR